MAHRTLWTVVLILLMSLIRLTAGHNHGIAAGSVIQRIQYTREFLLEFKPPADFKATPRIQRNFKAQSKQKRGKKGGIRQRLKKMKHRLPLPTCLLINAQSSPYAERRMSWQPIFVFCTNTEKPVFWRLQKPGWTKTSLPAMQSRVVTPYSEWTGTRTSRGNPAAEEFVFWFETSGAARYW